MVKLLHVFFRLLLAASLIGIGLHGLMNVNKSTVVAKETVARLEKFDLGPVNKAFPLVKQHLEVLITAHYGLFVFGGFLTIFGFCLAKLVIFLAVVSNLIFIHNAYLYRDDKMLLNALKYVSVFGGVWNL
jgi:hypothetical protein